MWTKEKGDPIIYPYHDYLFKLIYGTLEPSHPGMKGAPRSLVYKLVRSGQVRINGGRAKAERKLEVGDEVQNPACSHRIDARCRPFAAKNYAGGNGGVHRV